MANGNVFLNQKFCCPAELKQGAACKIVHTATGLSDRGYYYYDANRPTPREKSVRETKWTDGHARAH